MNYKEVWLLNSVFGNLLSQLKLFEIEFWFELKAVDELKVFEFYLTWSSAEDFGLSSS